MSILLNDGVFEHPEFQKHLLQQHKSRDCNACFTKKSSKFSECLQTTLAEFCDLLVYLYSMLHAATISRNIFRFPLKQKWIFPTFLAAEIGDKQQVVREFFSGISGSFYLCWFEHFFQKFIIL